ncbi:MgtC/SapB family protein, partial [bacterium]|nr:MgtC/SapB family protein [bacterium]
MWWQILEPWWLELSGWWQASVVDLRPEYLVRIGLSLFAGFVLGVERERHGRAAGLRTTLLVCLAACVGMILSDSFYLHSLNLTGNSTAWHPDPARLAAGALAGMGFLGAGVIVRQTTHLVRGVTTAATLWFATVLGLTFGAGAIGTGLLSTVIAFAILYILPHVESHIHDDWYSDLTILMDTTTSSVSDVLLEL